MPRYLPLHYSNKSKSLRSYATYPQVTYKKTTYPLITYPKISEKIHLYKKRLSYQKTFRLFSG